MERRSSENRLRGLRKAAGTAVLAVSLAACGSNNATETPRPTIVPTEKPTPTMTISPTETPMVTPTPEITPTPTPEATPELLAINTIVEGEHKAVKFDTVKADIENAYEQNPQAKSLYPYGVANLDTCKTGDNDPNPKIVKINREAYCEIFVANSYKTYIRTGDINFYNAARSGYNYSISSNGLGTGFKKTLDAYLKEVGLLQ